MKQQEVTFYFVNNLVLSSECVDENSIDPKVVMIQKISSQDARKSRCRHGLNV